MDTVTGTILVGLWWGWKDSISGGLDATPLADAK
jgi:hypothetical protein